MHNLFWHFLWGKTECYIWRPHPSVCGLLSATETPVRFSWNMGHKFFTISCWWRFSFKKIGAVKGTLYLEHTWNFSCIFYNFFSSKILIRIWPQKFIGQYEFSNNQRQEGQNLHNGINEFVSEWFTFLFNLGGIQYKGSKHQCCWALLSICENRCKKGHTFLLGINEITFMHVPTLSSLHHPITPPPFVSWPAIITFCTYCYNRNSIYQYGQVTATLRSKNITLLSLLFSRDHHSKHTVDQDQLSEWVMRKNNTPSNDTSNITVHCLHGQVFRTTRNER